MMNFDSTEYPHRRYNPLTDEYILVSPHRAKRPWLGQIEKLPLESLPEYDEQCYLCPGNLRANGERNPQYKYVFVFDNDYSALLPDTPQVNIVTHPLIRMQNVRGTCRVICYSPRHDVTLARLPLEQIRRVIDVWCEELSELGRTYRWVQIFENKGAIMGCSNPHPHGQIWAVDGLPNEPAREERQQKEYFRAHNQPLLLDYLDSEMAAGVRVVIQNEDWLAVVPFWAVWPFETLLMPRRHVQRLTQLSHGEKDSLADIMRALLIKYDNIFQVSFPYSMGWHGAPNDEDDDCHWQLHAHFYPPLLRSATVKKFMVGYEMLAEVQRDLTAEQAADKLRAVSNRHYLDL